MVRGPSLLPPKDLIFVIDCSRLNPREFRRLMSRLMLLLASQRRRTFGKFSYRGVDLDALLDMSTDELVKLFPGRARRR
ncbi:hypothetical protein KFK09_027219 [Dendrobium nobile]|uniref:Uncharacterized protein n=1 Tax=Dendrobium nobile TaxID=94219 RepID=A0A8T3AA31_DENNO|nr:hypothetical protein KFK09_027219 [Dendrobium nobile]